MAEHIPHAEHAGHHPAHESVQRRAMTSLAISATLRCLTGCAIGEEALGMALGTWWGWGTGPTIGLAVVLAFFFGYL